MLLITYQITVYSVLNALGFFTYKLLYDVVGTAGNAYAMYSMFFNSVLHWLFSQLHGGITPSK